MTLPGDDPEGRAKLEAAGFKVFPSVKMLCPRCGWHFPNGVCAPTEDAPPGDGPPPGALAICGECLAILQFDERMVPHALTKQQLEDPAVVPEADRAKVAQMWRVAYLARVLRPADHVPPKGPMQ